MKQDLVNYELALLAREKGFNNKVSSYYEYKVLKYKSKWGGFIDSVQTQFDYSDFEEGEDVVLVPTMYQLQTWLRETKGIHIKLDLYNDIEWYYDLIGCGEQYKDIEDFPNYLFDHNATTDTNYKTYEQALIAALFKSLKLIK